MSDSKESLVSVKDSIATQLLKKVFYFYLLLTIVVTLTHMLTEFEQAEKEVKNDLKVIAANWAPSLARALWDFNVDQLKPAFLGIIEFPSVLGVKFENDKGLVVGLSGIVTDKENKIIQVNSDGSTSEIKGDQGLIQYTFPIIHNYKNQEKITVGSGTIYSSRGMVFDRVKLGFVFLIVNAIIKTIALWAIFLWFSRSMLRRPLESLTADARRIKFDSLDNFEIQVKTKGRNELKVLGEAFNEMIQKLRLSRDQIEEKNKEIIQASEKLEEKVKSRTLDLQAAKEAAESSEQRLADTQRIARLGSWEVDVDSKHIAWSPETFRIAGMEVGNKAPTFEEYKNKVHPEDAPKLDACIERAMTQLKPYEVELRHHRPDGTYNHTITRGQPIVVDGRVVKLIGSVFDITERKLAEQALQRSEENYRTIFESANDAFFIHSLENGTVENVNEKMLDMYGYANKKEIVGSFVDKLSSGVLPYSDVEAGEWVGKAINGQPQLFVWQARRKNGELFWVEVNLKRAVIGGEEKLLAIVRDITERKRAESAMREAKESAEVANHAKSEFLANMSHEIRTPLNAIIGFSQIMLKENRKSPLPGDFPRFLENIKVSGEGLSEIINNVLDLSKIEAGKTTVLKETIDLKLLVRGIFHVNKAQAIEKGINFSYDVDPSLPRFILSDRSKLQQILMNLTANAVKFTEGGKSVKLAALKCGDRMEFQVADEGIGIREERLESIFNAFEQADTSTTRRFGGTGLGLAIVRQLSGLLGGTVKVESEEGKGSLFAASIPLVEAEGLGREAGEGGMEDLRFAGDSRVLMVEDNPMNLEMSEHLFKSLGIEIETAQNGEEGVQKCIDLKPHIVFMDMHMPVMDGLDATARIRQIPEIKDTPIVALSADAFREQENAVRHAGIEEYLTKPLELDKLLPVLKKYLSYEASPSTSTPGVNPPLPEEIKAEVLCGIKDLSEIPFYLTGKISDKAKEIRELCKGYDTSYPKVIREIEDAAFEKDSAKLKRLIEEAVDGE